MAQDIDITTPSSAPPSSSEMRGLKWLLAGGVAIVYYFSNPKPNNFYDYTFRIAEAMLHGRLGLVEAPPSWLNEMVPVGDRFYSVFPLGSVVTMLPVAVLKVAGVLEDFPAAIILSLVAGLSALFFFLLSARYGDTLRRRIALTLVPLFGTFMWGNLAFAGAWQIALGLAVAGQAGALYFTLVRPRPFIAGALFALAYGNRTEVILTAPLFVYFLMLDAELPREAATDARRATRDEQQGAARLSVASSPPTSSPTSSPAPSLASSPTPSSRASQPSHGSVREWLTGRLSERRRALASFLFVPFLLGLLTLVYNYARFASPLDFGYARIPGIMNEPWYRHGIFSLRAIPLNVDKMIFETWKSVEAFPYYTPTGFGGSIFLSSPFLLLLFRQRTRDRSIKIASWAAIVVMTFLLWCHGNPGGWQYSYRYAMVLLPWMFLIMLENGARRATRVEIFLLILSTAINACALYLFLWTDYVKP